MRNARAIFPRFADHPCMAVGMSLTAFHFIFSPSGNFLAFNTAPGRQSLK